MTTTLTDKRCRSAFGRLSDEMCKTYARAFPRKEAPDAFWSELAAVDEAVTRKLAQRPITELEVQAVVANAMTRFRELCSKHRR
jgi:hypothetical protein